MNFVKTIQTLFTNPNRLIQVQRYGRDDIQDIKQVSPFGIDSNPVKDLVAVYAETNETGENVIIGYLNRNLLESTEVGSLRFYSTNSNGEEQTYIKLTADGFIEMAGDNDFMVRYTPLEEGYEKTRSALDAIMSILTGPPISEPGNGSPSALQTALSSALTGEETGDISGSKIDEIKTI